MNGLRHSLALKLSMGILLSTIPIFIVSMGILYLQSRHIVREEATERAGSVLNATMQRVSNYLNTIETATNANDWFVTESLQPDSLLAWSHRIVLLNHNVSGCSITTEPYLFPQCGRYFSAYTIREADSITTVRESEYEYFEKVWYKTPHKLGTACWIDPFDDYNEGTLYSKEIIASYCKPLYGADSSFVGVISTDLSLRRLAETINTAHPYPHAYFMMIGKKGNYFIHLDSTRLFEQTIFSNTDPKVHADIIALGHEMTAGNTGNMRVDIDGQTCMVCYQPIPHTQWSLALVCPESDVLKGYHRLTLIITPLIIVGLTVILLLCLKATGHITRPLGELERISQQIAAGEYNLEIPRSRRRDAIGQLQNSFATMQQSLQRHVGDIEKANQEATARNEELARATRMAQEGIRQKTAFIQNVTHQIRTPLNIIMGFAQVLRDEFGELTGEEMAHIREMMKHNAMLLNRTLLMLFDSSETGLSQDMVYYQSREAVPCNQIARECIAYTQEHFPGMSIHFETSVDDSLCIHTNNLYIMRSVREVLYNSAKYSDGEHISLSITKAGDAVRFVLQDTGAGIPDDYHDMMFKTFTKVDDLSEGLGLGLPLTKRHIDNLGGRFIHDADYHEGCRIIIEMPLRS